VSGPGAYPGPADASRSVLDRWTQICGNAECRTGWLQIWRSRSTPRLEGAWACCAACMEVITTEAVNRSIADWQQGTARRELLMPLGLVLLSRGWITRDELKAALDAQRQQGCGRIGEWLCRLSALSQTSLAKGLAAQWNCTALTSLTSGIERADGVVPAALLDAYGLALVRDTTTSRLFLAGSSRAECAAARALEHMLNVPVEPAFLEDAVWLEHTRKTGEGSPATPPALGAVVEIARALERCAARDARIVRIHNHLWLRMFQPRRRKGSAEMFQDLVMPLQAEGAIVRAG
jgi:hypothetical protein